jgi:DNA processing protein
MIARPVQELLGPLSPTEEKNAPGKIYLQGDESLLRSGPRVSVIGTRNPSEVGRANARRFSEFLVQNGITVVSGLALGVDVIAHETAVQAGGRTIAVLGTPLDKVSPSSHATLQERIGREHLLISQFPSGFGVHRSNFPQRNRTMALISDATIIIEAGETSGTLHQGYEALRLGRPLFILSSVITSGLAWPAKMLDYGAFPVSEPKDLYEILPIHMEVVCGESPSI